MRERKNKEAKKKHQLCGDDKTAIPWEFPSVGTHARDTEQHITTSRATTQRNNTTQHCTAQHHTEQHHTTTQHNNTMFTVAVDGSTNDQPTNQPTPSATTQHNNTITQHRTTPQHDHSTQHNATQRKNTMFAMAVDGSTKDQPIPQPKPQAQHNNTTQQTQHHTTQRNTTQHRDLSIDLHQCSCTVQSLWLRGDCGRRRRINEGTKERRNEGTKERRNAKQKSKSQNQK